MLDRIGIYGYNLEVRVRKTALLLRSGVFCYVKGSAVTVVDLWKSACRWGALCLRYERALKENGNWHGARKG